MALVPVRCFTCRRVTGQKWVPYVRALQAGQTVDEALNGLGVKAPCCRQTLFAHMDTLERLLRYQQLETANMKVSMQATAGGVEDLEEDGADED